MARLLLSAGADANLDGKGTWGHWYSPLATACMANDVEMARCLIDARAQVNHYPESSAPALIQAGLEPIAVHLFIFYWGMLSYITPPLALGVGEAASSPRLWR